MTKPKINVPKQPATKQPEVPATITFQTQPFEVAINMLLEAMGEKPATRNTALQILEGAKVKPQAAE